MPKPLSALKEFLRLEASGGIILLALAILAMLMANSPLSGAYAAFLEIPVEVRIGPLQLAKPLLLWINDGLMAVFFFLVGLEIKREMVEGELSSLRQAALPLIAALGGMVVPALVYLVINRNHPDYTAGWAIPAATDIAFALGVLALLGARIPLALKVFLTALAIFDDLGAIIIIALFYTANLSVGSLMVAAAAIAALAVLNAIGVRRVAAYVLVGIVLWVAVLKSGVHATLAGVVLALFVPIAEDGHGHSPLRHLEHILHPWVAFLVLPVFAFANAGVPLTGLGLDALAHPVTLGVGLGLLVGKQVGVFLFTFAAIKLGLGSLPAGANWKQLYGVSVLAGIGFTMSLFIASLAFPQPDMAAATRLGVLGGSIVSALLGYALLRLTPPARVAVD